MLENEMGTDRRIERIENRVDEIKDDVAELKGDFKTHTRLIEDHITGDQKIITEIQPLLSAIPHITEMAKEYTYNKENKTRRQARIKSLSLRFGLGATILGIITTTLKLLGLF